MCSLLYAQFLYLPYAQFMDDIINAIVMGAIVFKAVVLYAQCLLYTSPKATWFRNTDPHYGVKPKQTDRNK